MQNEIIYIQRPIDKKKIVFYKDRLALPVDDDFQKLWRSVAVDAMDEAKIDEYLEKQGLFLLIYIFGKCVLLYNVITYTYLLYI